MKKVVSRSKIIWSSILVFSVFFCAFVFPVISGPLGDTFHNVGYTLIFLSGAMSLERRRSLVLGLSVGATLMEWITEIFHLTILNEVSRALNVLFFLIMIFFLIGQIASTRNISARVILGSITGYLLLGLGFSVIVGAMIQYDPLAFNLPPEADVPNHARLLVSKANYFGFITMATVGYGDIVPIKPYARSFATLIAISGQLYIAIIISLLIGKFAAKRDHSNDLQDAG